jgi:hypothetical protein
MFGKRLSGSKMEMMTDLMKMDCEYGEWKKKTGSCPNTIAFFLISCMSVHNHPIILHSPVYSFSKITNRSLTCWLWILIRDCHVDKTTRIEKPIHMRPEDGKCSVCWNVGNSRYSTRLILESRNCIYFSITTNCNPISHKSQTFILELNFV